MMTTTIHTPVHDKLYDLSYVERLARGRNDVLVKLMHTFITTVPAAASELKSAFYANDFEKLRSIIHKIKPVLSVYAVVSVEKDLERIKQLAEAGLADAEMEASIHHLYQVIELISKSLEENIATLNTTAYA